jgi:hypothetical protein
VQTVLPRGLAKLLTRATQPGLVSPGGGDQAQWYHAASLLSESGEILRHFGCYPVKQTRSVVMRSQCAGAALDPPLWNIPSLVTSLGHHRVRCPLNCYKPTDPLLVRVQHNPL